MSNYSAIKSPMLRISIKGAPSYDQEKCQQWLDLCDINGED